MTPSRILTFPSRILTFPDRVTPTVIAWMAVGAATVSFAAFGGTAYAIVAVTQQSQRTADTAQELCERTMRFGPQIAKRYAENGWLDPSQIRAYRETIPTGCAR